MPWGGVTPCINFHFMFQTIEQHTAAAGPLWGRSKAPLWDLSETPPQPGAGGLGGFGGGSHVSLSIPFSILEGPFRRVWIMSLHLVLHPERRWPPMRQKRSGKGRERERNVSRDVKIATSGT